MKLRVLIGILFPVTVLAQGPLTITGTITGLKEGDHVILTDAQRQTDTLGTARVKNGTFIIKATTKEPMLVNISFTADKNYLTFLESGTVKITGDIANPKKLKFTGSKMHDDFNDFQAKFDPLFESLMKVNQRMQMGENSDSLMTTLNQTKANIQKAIDAFINSKPASAVSAFLLSATMQLSDDVLLTEQRLNKLKQSAVENMYGIYLKETIADTKLTAIGAPAMDFTQTDTAGIPVSLSSFRGKYVLVDFWASWCGPCRQENPNVVANWKRFNGKNFTVLGISLDRPGQHDRWLQAIHADNLTWTHVSDLQFWNNSVAVQYKVQSIPRNLLVGPDGKIVAKDLRGAALENKLCELLGCN